MGRGAEGDDYIDLCRGEIDGIDRQPCGIVIREAILERDVAAVEPAKRSHTLVDCVSCLLRRAEIEESHARQARSLLCRQPTSCKRGGEKNREKGDQLPFGPFHGTLAPPRLAVTSISIFMRPSTSPQTKAVAAGRIWPKTSPRTGTIAGQSPMSGT